MPDYKVPLRDIQFAYQEVLQIPQRLTQISGNDEFSTELISAVMDEAAKFAERVLAPLHQQADQQGCQLKGGDVFTPEGFKEAYQQFVDNGWASLAQSEKYGGQGLPVSMQMAFYEMLVSANLAWGLCPTTTWGAITTLESHASPALQAKFLPEMVSGRWTGTMCLTEPHCGSDLGLLRTRAVPNADGSYNITGTKIFISSGEHDMADNIVHIVLARLEGAPEGTRGISLFLVPKYHVNDDASLGEKNHVSCGSIEHKMGLHGNPTCVMNFDGAQGYLLGEENRGLNCMFTFINESRIDVCLQAQGQIERSFQGALAYAKDREQMKATPRANPERPADPIIAHPEIRRLLLTQQAFSEGARLLAYDLAGLADTVRSSANQDAVQDAEAALGYLTPIAKGFITEVAVEATNHGIQVFGGHGFVQEWGMEQLARDVRITSIYEGTTAIQGLDLIGRKLIADDRVQFDRCVAQMLAFCEQSQSLLPAQCDTLRDAIEAWADTTQGVISSSLSDGAEMNAAAVDYLMMSGYVITGYYLLRSAVTAKQQEPVEQFDQSFLDSKLHLADFYVQKILPRIYALKSTLAAGKTCLLNMDYSESA